MCASGLSCAKEEGPNGQFCHGPASLKATSCPAWILAVLPCVTTRSKSPAWKGAVSWKGMGPGRYQHLMEASILALYLFSNILILIANTKPNIIRAALSIREQQPGRYLAGCGALGLELGSGLLHSPHFEAQYRAPGSFTGWPILPLLFIHK